MLNWLKKAVVSFVAIITFGTVAPPSATHMGTGKSESAQPDSVGGKVEKDTAYQSESEQSLEKEEVEAPFPDFSAMSWQEVAASSLPPEQLRERFATYSMEEAEKRGFEKFGPVIANRVGDQYREYILPKVGQVMATLTDDLDEDALRQLKIFDDPSPGTGERLFHVMDTKNQKDMVRFHVRRDHPPKDGYWFNFHYHLPSDQFQGHYELGKIYWDQDTPPQWRA